MSDWLILTATLPTRPSGLRVRVWRALRATHAGSLREGVYVLPAHAPTAPALERLAVEIVEAGAGAHLLRVAAHDAQQDAAFRALFDRTPDFAALQQQIRQTRTGLREATEPALRRAARQLEQQLQALREGDFFPDRAGERAAAALAALRHEIERRFSPGEPAGAPAVVEHLRVDDFQGRTWATRRRPWIDRLATAWLVARFVDRRPSFVWLASPRQCPKDALGYDFDGARFTHAGELVTFEVVARAFGLDAGAGIARLGALVHSIDVGGGTDAEAAGVEALARGLQALHADDDALLAAALPLFDALHAAFGATP